MDEMLLEAVGLRVAYIDSRGARTSVLDNLTFSIRRREIYGLVGESGCGKSTLALTLMGLLPAESSVEGAVRFQDTDLVAASESTMRTLRGRHLSIVFQDPLTSLDPSFSVGDQIAETVLAHRDVSRNYARERALELLQEVGIDDAARRYRDPPHKFSGGMQQRVVLAIALANEPDLLIADEPTTALDVTVQAQILKLLLHLRERHGMAILLITHDLAVVAQFCTRAAVLYAGQLIEVATTSSLFGNPQHPYTRAMLAAVPRRGIAPGDLRIIEGEIPDLASPPCGCRFRPRCPEARAACTSFPPRLDLAPDHSVACWARLQEATTEPTEQSVATHRDAS